MTEIMDEPRTLPYVLPMRQEAQDNIDFGFADIPRTEKAQRVRGVFDRVARKYDLMNDAMSFGLHRVWKNDMVRRLGPRPGQRIIDMAGGTGDIAFRIHRACPEAKVLLCDINNAMLTEGRARAFDRNVTKNIHWYCASAESLPFMDQSAHAYTIAFGIRNVTDIAAALREAYRVLKPGGHFLCLEFSTVRSEPLRKLYDAYSFHVIPRMGEALAGDAAPYRYLVESIRRFPSRKAFAEMIAQAGFSRTSYTNMAGGAVALHSAWRI
jgi:ubiquinone/menaquinone biosynthesis methyltransferase